MTAHRNLMASFCQFWTKKPTGKNSDAQFEYDFVIEGMYVIMGCVLGSFGPGVGLGSWEAQRPSGKWEVALPPE